jgi:NAD(P)-dependent dehydrogenase (short-subunit alcohol dehydrogenase family)
VAADVGDAGAVEASLAPLFAAGAGALVHCAGVVGTGDIETIAPEEWDRQLRVNLTSVFLTSRVAVRAMRPRGEGRIVLFSSVGGQSPALSAGVPYSAAKAGTIGFARTLARQVAGAGITVNVVSPGRLETPMFRTAHAEPERLSATVPLGRLGMPDDIAGAVAFLLSPDAAFITGATLDVNGGAFMR